MKLERFGVERFQDLDDLARGDGDPGAGSPGVAVGVPGSLQPYTPRLRYHLLDEHRVAEAARATGRPLPANLAGVAVGIETIFRNESSGEGQERLLPSQLRHRLPGRWMRCLLGPAD